MDPTTPDLDDAPRWTDALRAAYARSLQEGSEQWRHARAAVDAGDVPASALAQAALLALETMGPDDPTSLGMSACDALRHYGGADQLERLRAVRPTLPARKGLRDWRVDAGHALEVIEARAAGSCTCEAEATRGAAVHGEQWQVESEDVDTAQYCVRMTVRCTRCHSRWQVRRSDGYHYPIFSWTKA